MLLNSLNHYCSPTAVSSACSTIWDSMYDETTSLISRYLSGAIFCGPEAAHFEMRAPVVFRLLHRLLIDTTPNEVAMFPGAS